MDSFAMLKPAVQVGLENDVFVAEFWDCLRLDPVPVQDLRHRFEEHLRNGGGPNLVVDMLGVGFAGSAALGGFVAIQRLARRGGGRMVFCNMDRNVYEVFRVGKLDKLYSFSPDRATALADLNSAEPSPVAIVELPAIAPKAVAPSILRRKARDV